MSRPEQIMIDRFPVANAEFWLSMMAHWLAEPGHADQFAADLWPGFSFAGPPVQVIVAETVDRLQASLRDPHHDHDHSHDHDTDPESGSEPGWSR